jgi:hypothetical protein
MQPSGLIARSWGLCSLIGPRDRNPGVFGTDLGLTARRPNDDKLTVLFGDTWVRPVNACQYPGGASDDLQALLPVQRPADFQPGAPRDAAAASCNLLQYERDKPDDVTSWQRIRLFPSPVAHSDDTAMDMSILRTPAAAFSDGQRMFGIFYRNEPVFCDAKSPCPEDFECSSDVPAPAKPLGQCTPQLKLTPDATPDYCRDDGDCAGGTRCEPAARGACLADKPFRLHTAQGSVVPTWYRDDPRRAIARTMYVAAALWPERPSDYATLARFATNRFQNLAVRGVAYFDAEHPERNDYRPGYHTLLIWGRSSFVEYGGAQALPFLSYVPLAELQGEPEAVRFQPRFFAGYDERGNPSWSQHESDAQPVYGTEARVVDAHTQSEKIAWREPDFDYVEWAGMSYIAPLRRWVMLYGGDLPAFMVLDPRTGRVRDPVHLQFAPGAIHMRSAPHPWGRRRSSDSTGWSSAEPILTRSMIAPYLACGSGDQISIAGCIPEREIQTPLAVRVSIAGAANAAPSGSLAKEAASCIAGEVAQGMQKALSGDLVGRLYAPNIIDDWTVDLTPPDRAQSGPHSVEIYWNVSTWNPYQVVLVKSQIDERYSAGRLD